MLQWYSADIGTWESGKVVRFQANSHREAMRIAHSHGNVVKVRVGAKSKGNANQGLGRVIWDEFNGSIPYEGEW